MNSKFLAFIFIQMVLLHVSAFSQNKKQKKMLERAHKTKDYKKSLIFYDKAVALDSFNYNAYYSRGYRHYNNGEYEKAVIDFKKAQKLNPHDECSYRMGAASKKEIKDFDGAIKDYGEIFNWNPNSYSVYWDIARVNIDKDDCKEALVNLNKALAIDPGNEDILYDKVRALFGLDSLDEALLISKKIEHKQEPNEYLIDLQGLIYLKRKEYASAVVKYTWLLEHYTEKYNDMGFYNFYLLTQRAKSKYFLEDYASAIDDFNQLNFEGCKDGEPYFYYGACLIERGSVSEGCKLLSRAGELGYKDAYEKIKEACK